VSGWIREGGYEGVRGWVSEGRESAPCPRLALCPIHMPACCSASRPQADCQTKQNTAQGRLSLDPCPCLTPSITHHPTTQQTTTPPITTQGFLARSFKNSEQGRAIADECEQRVVASGGVVDANRRMDKHVRRYATGFAHQTAIVSKRAFIAVLRNPATSIFQVRVWAGKGVEGSGRRGAVVSVVVFYLVWVGGGSVIGVGSHTQTHSNPTTH
jgi:hypothetical protein